MLSKSLPLEKSRRWRILAGGVAAGVAGVVGFAGTTAAADPVLPAPPVPAPVTVTQTVTATPAAADPAPAAADPAPAAAPATVGTAPAAVTTTPAPAVPVLVPASSGTIRDYLQERGVRMEPQDPRTFRALQITLPMPTGWTQVPDPNVPDAYAVIADRAGGDGLYTSNAQVVIYKLLGDFDPNEAITHGFIDSQQMPGWQSTDGSLGEFGGFPSSIIEGTYRDGDLTLNTSRRHVLASSGSDKYLVTMSVITALNQVVATADATDGIVRGFKVTDPAAPAPAPAAPPASSHAAPPAPGPAAPVLPELPGLLPSAS